MLSDLSACSLKGWQKFFEFLGPVRSLTPRAVKQAILPVSANGCGRTR
jgi:hypothetical protein